MTPLDDMRSKLLRQAQEAAVDTPQFRRSFRERDASHHVIIVVGDEQIAEATASDPAEAELLAVQRACTALQLRLDARTGLEEPGGASSEPNGSPTSTWGVQDRRY